MYRLLLSFPVASKPSAFEIQMQQTVKEMFQEKERELSFLLARSYSDTPNIYT